MRVIAKDELPSSGPFFVKLPATHWFRAKLEVTANTFLVKLLDSEYTPPYDMNLVQEAAAAGWMWNTEEKEAGARPFWIAEPRDAELRALVRSAGANSKAITVTRRDGSTFTGKLTDFPHTAGQLQFTISTSAGNKTISWFDVVDVRVASEGGAGSNA